ncbi:MAG: DUF4412 domain-containing protein [Flavobacteriales bacterium]|nr:DUF4412 domain-containing protein [Flavobacteriales bacterium]
MRLPLLLLALCSLHLSLAQIDMNKLLQQRSQQQQGQGAPPADGATVSVEEDNDPYVPNTFIGSFRMEMHTYKNDKEEKDSPMNVRFASKADMTVVQPEVKDKGTQDMRMLTDLKNKWQYTLMTDDKGRRTAMKQRKTKVSVKENKTDKSPEPTVVRTEETKVIEGHPCRKYIVTTDDGTWTGWIAEDLKGPFMDMARNMVKSDALTTARMPKDMEGFPLEYEWVEKGGKEKMVCYIRELKVGAVDEHLFSLDGYEVMELPSFAMPR